MTTSSITTKSVHPVRSGATVGIFTSSSPLSPERFELGVGGLRARGFASVCPVDPTAFYGKSDHGFASDSIRRRVESIHMLLADPAVSMLLAARGAYGTLDILPHLDYELIARARKPIVGSSDVTALLLQVVSRCGVPAIHGPTLGSSFADAAEDRDAAESVERLFELLTDPAYQTLSRGEVLGEGRARAGSGMLLGGNLTMLLTLLGTPWDVDYRGAILCVEEVGEAPYRIHRAFTQLKLAGKLDHLAGIAFGRFAKCESKQGPSLDEVLGLIVRDLLPAGGFPVIRGLEFGHWGKNVPLPLGCRAEIHDGTLQLCQSPIGE